MKRLSFKTQFKIKFLGPFYGPKIPRETLGKDQAYAFKVPMTRKFLLHNEKEYLKL